MDDAIIKRTFMNRTEKLMFQNNFKCPPNFIVWLFIGYSTIIFDENKRKMQISISLLTSVLFPEYQQSFVLLSN